jgi:hypothetical protein
MFGLTLSKSATGGKAWASPYKSQHKIGSSDNNSEAGRYEKEEKEDTKAFLKKTEETVEEMKRSCADNVQTVNSYTTFVGLCEKLLHSDRSS